MTIPSSHLHYQECARGLQKDGTVPPCVDEPGIYTAVRSGDFVADAKIAWRDAYEMQMRPQSARCNRRLNRNSSRGLSIPRIAREACLCPPDNTGRKQADAKPVVSRRATRCPSPPAATNVMPLMRTAKLRRYPCAAYRGPLLGLARGIDCKLPHRCENVNYTVRRRGYWVKITAQPIEATEGRPHGIKYALTLHDPDGRRIYGLDNAHGVRRRRPQFDHRHIYGGRQVIPYAYRGPVQLLEDFYAEVERILRVRGVM